MSAVLGTFSLLILCDVLGLPVPAHVLVVGFPLYAASRNDVILQNATRKQIIALLRLEPGLTIAELARRTDVAHQTACYHLDVLQRAGHVEDYESGNARRQVLKGTSVAGRRHAYMALARDTRAMTVLAVIVAKPGITMAEAARAVGASRAGGAYHIEKLVDAGVVTKTRRGGRTSLRVVPERITEFVVAFSGLPGPRTD